MAEASESVFNKSAAKKLHSPEELDKYVRIMNPSVVVILLACIALLAGILAWGVFGAVATSVSATGVVVDGHAMCFLPAEDIEKVNVGDEAMVGGQPMTVSELSAVPLSRSEASSALKSDYLVKTAVPDDWAYRVDFEGDASSLANGVPVSVAITTNRIAPISLILGGDA